MTDRRRRWWKTTTTENFFGDYTGGGGGAIDIDHGPLPPPPGPPLAILSTSFRFRYARLFIARPFPPPPPTTTTTVGRPLVNGILFVFFFSYFPPVTYLAKNRNAASRRRAVTRVGAFYAGTVFRRPPGAGDAAREKPCEKCNFIKKI